KDDDEARARNVAIWRGISMAAQTMAFGVPGSKAGMAASGVLGAVSGFATGMESMADYQAPVINTSFSDTFEAILEQDEVQKAREEFAALSLADAGSPGAYRSKLKSLSRTLSQATRRQLRDVITSGFASQDDMRFDEATQQNPEFMEAFDQMVQLTTEKQLFQQKVAETTQLMREGAGEIERLVDLQASLGRAHDDNKVDELLRKQMSAQLRASREALMRLQYYLAKSYEYRLLKPCPIDFRQLNELDRALERVGLAGNANPTNQAPLQFAMDSEVVDLLRTAFRSQLEKIARRIIIDMEETFPEATIGRELLPLYAHEIEQLNTKGHVRISLRHRIVYPEEDLNARILNVEVVTGDLTDIQLVKRPDDDAFTANFALIMEPAGNSVIRWDNRDHYFCYGQQAKAGLVRWAYRWNPIEDAGSHDELSDDQRSLLMVLLNSMGDRPAAQLPRQIHFRPGAMGDLIIRKQVRTDRPDEIDIEVKKLTLALQIQRHTTRL
ncbi:MAG: hypothetical protein AAF492_11760, partial [Verrucomicrobiota bacterium]